MHALLEYTDLGTVIGQDADKILGPKPSSTLLALHGSDISEMSLSCGSLQGTVKCLYSVCYTGDDLMLEVVGDVRRRIVRVTEGVWSGMLCRDVELELHDEERTAGEESWRWSGSQLCGLLHRTWDARDLRTSGSLLMNGLFVFVAVILFWS
jgi:hypothetical protein